jgi:hypothetical protein
MSDPLLCSSLFISRGIGTVNVSLLKRSKYNHLLHLALVIDFVKESCALFC